MSSPAGRRRLVLAIAVLGVAILVPLVLVAIPPSGWSPVPSDPVAAESRGEALERFLSAEFSKVRTDDAPWAIRLREDDVNAWIATRLPKWEANAGNPPPPASEVRFRDGALHLRVVADSDAFSPVLEAMLSPAVTAGPAGDRLEPRVRGVSAGRLPLPWFGPALLRALSLGAGGSVTLPGGMTLDSVGDAEGFSTAYALSDGRTLHLDAIAVEDGALVLEFRTRPR